MFFDPRKDGLKPAPLSHNVYNALVTPRPIGWISTLSKDGVANLAPFSFFNMVSAEPMYVIVCANGRHPDGGRKDSAVNALETGEFVYNACDAELMQAMNDTAEHMPRSIDEMIAAGLEPEPSEMVAVPRVKAAKVHLECKYMQTVELPNGPDGSPNLTIFGEVIGIHIADDVLTDGMIDPVKMRPLARLGYLDYAIIDQVFAMKRPKEGQHLA
jgi:flavin reductase (DIM6/NTAB) family NADH-FMN oxidoreductase RutF